MKYEPVIGLEIHAELATRSKMFCSCPVIDITQSEPNSAVCPICAGMPGVLPVVNKRAVEFALRVALSLNCKINSTSTFARKNYFYPDLPKGYQITQYEQPLAINGQLTISLPSGQRTIGIRRVHLEEDTGKLTHIQNQNNGHARSYSLVDLNRAGIPLLEIVTEPDFRSAESVRVFAESLRTILRFLEVNSGDMEKGVMRIEPNVSVRPTGSAALATRTEIKNLNSFRSLERSIDFEIHRQINLVEQNEEIIQQTMGWDEKREVTIPQRSKEEAHDYRYFPEPDLPPLQVEQTFIDEVKSRLPELPDEKFVRFQKQYNLNAYDSGVLVSEKSIADYFEAAVQSIPNTNPKLVANWMMGELFSLMNKEGIGIEEIIISPNSLSGLIQLVSKNEINQNTGKNVLAEMFATGISAEVIVDDRNLRQISDDTIIRNIVDSVLAENPEQVKIYLQGKESISKWLYGQVMRQAKGKANPQIVRKQLDEQLSALKNTYRS